MSLAPCNWSALGHRRIWNPFKAFKQKPAISQNQQHQYIITEFLSTVSQCSSFQGRFRIKTVGRTRTDSSRCSKLKVKSKTDPSPYSFNTPIFALPVCLQRCVAVCRRVSTLFFKLPDKRFNAHVAEHDHVTVCRMKLQWKKTFRPWL